MPAKPTHKKRKRGARATPCPHHPYSLTPYSLSACPYHPYSLITYSLNPSTQTPAPG